MKEQLKYIGCYIRRPAIALHRIEEYDGEFVTFKYVDKNNDQEKREKITVEEFIGRLIQHIPEEQFKTIRYYGIYSQRISGMAERSPEVDSKSKKTITRRNCTRVNLTMEQRAS